MAYVQHVSPQVSRRRFSTQIVSKDYTDVWQRVEAQPVEREAAGKEWQYSYEAAFPRLGHMVNRLKNRALVKCAAVLNLYLLCVHLAEIVIGNAVGGLISIFLDVVFFAMIHFLWVVTTPNDINVLDLYDFLGKHIQQLRLAAANVDAPAATTAQLARIHRFSELCLIASGILSGLYALADLVSVLVSYAQGDLSLLFLGLRLFGVLNGMRAALLASYFFMILTMLVVHLELHVLQTEAFVALFRKTRRAAPTKLNTTVALQHLASAEPLRSGSSRGALNEGDGDGATAPTTPKRTLDPNEDAEGYAAEMRDIFVEEYQLIAESLREAQRSWQMVACSLIVVISIGVIASMTVFVLVPGARFRFAMAMLALFVAISTVFHMIARVNREHDRLAAAANISGPSDFMAVGGRDFWSFYTGENKFGFAIFDWYVSYRWAVPALSTTLLIIGVIFVWAAAS